MIVGIEELIIAFLVSHQFQTDADWARFVRQYRAAMKTPDNARSISLLAALSHQTAFSVGCYCEDVQRCHRSVLRDLLVEAGALMETDQQRGLAHFIEHMGFNGTRNFPPGQLIEYSRSLVIGIEGRSTYAPPCEPDEERAPCIFGATTVTVCPARSRNSRWSRIDTCAPPRESRC